MFLPETFFTAGSERKHTFSFEQSLKRHNVNNHKVEENKAYRICRETVLTEKENPAWKYNLSTMTHRSYNQGKFLAQVVVRIALQALPQSRQLDGKEP